MVTSNRIQQLRTQLLTGRLAAVLLGVLMIALGVGTSECLPEHYPDLATNSWVIVAQEAAKLLGTALVVSYGLLGWYKRRENEYLGRMVYKTLFGPYVEDSAVDQIRDEVGLNPIVRRNAEWAFHVTKDDGFLVLAQTSKSELTNRASKTMPIRPPRVQAMDQVDIRSYQITDETGVHNCEACDYQLDGSNTVSDQLIARGRFSNEVRCSHYTSHFIANLTIEVAYPNGYCSIEDLHMPNHATRSPEQDSRHIEGGRAITITVPYLLPHQGISLIVRPAPVTNA